MNNFTCGAGVVQTQCDRFISKWNINMFSKYGISNFIIMLIITMLLTHCVLQIVCTICTITAKNIFHNVSYTHAVCMIFKC